MLSFHDSMRISIPLTASINCLIHTQLEFILCTWSNCWRELKIIIYSYNNSLINDGWNQPGTCTNAAGLSLPPNLGNNWKKQKNEAVSWEFMLYHTAHCTELPWYGINNSCLHWVCALIIGQNLRDFPASWGQVADAALLTLRLRITRKKTTQQSGESPIMWPSVEFSTWPSLSSCVPHIISTDTEIIWQRMKCICCTKPYLIYSR